MYSKELLVGAFVNRFIGCRLISVEQISDLEKMGSKFYDEVGRDRFRVYAQVTPEAIKNYVDEFS